MIRWCYSCANFCVLCLFVIDSAEEGAEENADVAAEDGGAVAAAVESESSEAKEVAAEGEPTAEGEDGAVAGEEAKPMEAVDFLQVRSEAGVAVIPPFTIPPTALGGMYELVFSDVTASSDLLKVPPASVKIHLLGFGEEDDPKGKKKKKKK